MNNACKLIAFKEESTVLSSITSETEQIQQANY